ncbi:unnamed protein product [Orchesella dallaii]|uniref:Uncharacterized protein n=1 Tax=Orchesella dallaii TaxID=48710 RepID=A0ABP1S1S5_9HEXA
MDNVRNLNRKPQAKHVLSGGQKAKKHSSDNHEVQEQGVFPSTTDTNSTNLPVGPSNEWMTLEIDGKRKDPDGNDKVRAQTENDKFGAKEKNGKPRTQDENDKLILSVGQSEQQVPDGNEEFRTSGNSSEHEVPNTNETFSIGVSDMLMESSKSAKIDDFDASDPNTWQFPMPAYQKTRFLSPSRHRNGLAITPK